jgi:uncharacterized protein
MPTWDEAKRRKNLREHGFDFEGCEALFDGPLVVLEDKRGRYGERASTPSVGSTDRSST